MKNLWTLRNAVWLGIFIGLLVISIFGGGLQIGGTEAEPENIYLWQIVLFVEAFYITMSFTYQRPEFNGALYQWGEFVAYTDPGPVFAPIGVYVHRIENRNRQQFEIPTDTIPRENWHVGEDGKPEPPTLRMTHDHNPNKPGIDKNDPLNQGRLTTEVIIIIWYRITKVKNFIATFGSLTNFRQQVEDLAVKETTKEFAQKTAGETLKSWGDIEKKVSQQVHNLAKWGVHDDPSIVDADELPDSGVQVDHERGVGIKSVDLTHAINTSFSDQMAAFVNIKTGEHEGMREKVKNELVALGNKAIRKQFLMGEGEAFNSMKKKLGWSKEEMLMVAQSQMVRDALEQANFNLLSTDGGSVGGIVGAMQQAYELSKTAEKPSGGSST